MDQTTQHPDIASLRALIAQLERRISRIEDRLLLSTPSPDEEPRPVEQPGNPEATETQDELEYQVGQNWFAKTGIVVLAIGMALLLTFPFKEIPPYIPSLVGGILVVVLYFLSRAWRESYPLLARYLFGAGMALMYFSALRLCFFSASAALSALSAAGITLLLATSIANILFGLNHRSPYLLALAITCLASTVLVTETVWIPVVALPLLAVFISIVRLRFATAGFYLYGLALTFLTVLLEAMNKPVLGHPLQLVASPLWSTFILLPCIAAFAIGVLLRRDHRPEDWMQGVESFATIFFGYGVFTGLTLAAVPPLFVAIHLVASALLLGLAIAFWLREKSSLTTFFYAMAGYLALSIAIVKGFSSPSVFVWLALQSIVVVATAIWFRSRFIIVANFIIYLSIIVAYLFVVQEESGLSLGFGIVALVSARILNWQQHRLALKTGAMRNAYLGIAFLIFPYALYHMLPRQYVSLSWIGIAGLYYALNVVIKAQKYRWMGHLTLMLTVLYVVIVGIIQLEPAYRIMSFLALAIALLAVSMAFTRLRSRRNIEAMKPHPPT